MANTVVFNEEEDGRIRVTVHSEGERDESATITRQEFINYAANLNQAAAEPDSEGV